MIYPEITTKEKRKSFILKIKVSKKELREVSAEDLTELKRGVLEEISYELDNLVYETIDLDGDLTYDDVKENLDRVSIETNDYDTESVYTEEETENVTEVEGDVEEA